MTTGNALGIAVDLWVMRGTARRAILNISYGGKSNEIACGKQRRTLISESKSYNDLQMTSALEEVAARDNFDRRHRQ